VARSGDRVLFLQRISRLAAVLLLTIPSVSAWPPIAPLMRPPAGGPREISGGTGFELSSLLNRTGDYCDKLSRAVLNFVCRERIDEWLYGQGQDFNEIVGTFFITNNHMERYKYVYDYQLVRDRAGHIRESRILLQEQGKKVEVPDAPLKTHIFKHAYVVMGPLGLLGRDHQADFDYRIAREEKVGGDEAVVIEAVPKPGVRVDYLFGTVWLRKKDAGILKIQWNPSSLENYEALERDAQRLKRKPGIIMISEYAFETNGIRFPSRYTVKEDYRGRHGGHFVRSETVVLYDRYKFFTVETEVKF